jgi:uncharacterized RDD family membrane protein YckC
MFCSRCGKEVGEGNQFCQFCGQEVGGAAIAAPVVQNAPPYVSPSATIAAPLPYAGFWERVAAYLIDGLILSIPFGAVVIALIFMFGGFGMMLHRNAVDAPADPAAAFALMAPLFGILAVGMIVFVGLQWLYFAGMESSERQATFGKSVMSLHVSDYEGRRISFGHATGQFFAKIVSGMIPFAIGYIMAAFTEKKQALHDLIAGTLVLKR